MRIAIEMIEGLQYKLRMMGVPIEGPCNVFCNNNAVVINSKNPESMLKKKHAAINYHCTREAIAAKAIQVAKEDTSTFGSEFVAMRIAIEMIEGLRYKLRMMGVPIEGPCNVFCDNNAVVINSKNPESMLKKKHASINYHRTREAIAAKTIQVAKEDTSTNLADLLTKCNPGPTLKSLILKVLW